MTIAFDGNVFAGKSSLIKTLFSLIPAVIIDEHGAFLDTRIPSHLVKDLASAKSLQLHYFDAEDRRSKYLEPRRYNFLDRSFVSMAAHIFALLAIHNIDIRDWFLTEMEKRLIAGKIIVPDVYCFVRCNHNIIRQRVLVNPSRDTDPFFYEEKYLTAIDYFNEAWSKRVRGIVIDTDTIKPTKLGHILIQRKFLSNQEGRSKQYICDSLWDMLTRRNTKLEG